MPSPKAHPGIIAHILDLSTVAPIAQRHIDKAGVADRVSIRAGNLRTGRLGEGYDLVFISAFSHRLSPEQNCDLLRRSHAALAPGGRVVIQDSSSSPARPHPNSPPCSL